MTVPNGDQNANAQGQDPNGGAGTGTGDNPMYQEYLERIPEDLRPTVADVFKDWDAKTTQEFQKRSTDYQSLQSEYEPYKEYVETYEPEAIGHALSILESLQADPKAFYENLAEAFNLNGSGDGGQPATQQQNPVLEQPVNDPRVEQLMQQQEQIAQMLAQQQASAQQQQEDAALDALLADLKGKHGEFDEDYVLGLIGVGVDPTVAVERYNTAVGRQAQQLNQPNAQAPQVMGSGGGGYPSQQVDVTKMSEKERVAHVIATIQAAQNA